MILWLISANELDSDYNHIPWFKSTTTQGEYFRVRTLHVLDDYMYQRKSNLVFNIDKTLNELDRVNYLLTFNDDGKKYFYFVINKEYVSDYVTKVYLQLDVIQTYMFDIQFNDCLIEREHCNRWLKYENGKVEPIQWIEDENIDTGEYVLKSEKEIYNYRTKGTYIYSSSERLGISKDGRPSPSSGSGEQGGGGTSGKNYLNGYADKNGMRFLKSVEGFRSEPYNIGDGTNTIGYGITEVHQPTYYEKLYPSCTEQQASEILGEVMYNFSGQIKNNLDSENYNWDNMNQGLFNALTSFAYNSGVGGLLSYEIWNMVINNSDKESIATIWETTNIMAGTEFEQGLRARRKKEADMIRGTYDYKSALISNDGIGYIIDNDGYGFIPSEYN